MDHVAALNHILANACPSEIDVNGRKDTYKFYIETHCVGFWVIAKLVSTVETIQYEVISVEFA